MPLTDAAIRGAKPGDKAIRLFDGGGLYLEVSTAGGKLWRLKYRFGGKEKRLALGVYPEVGLREARDNRDEARKQLRDGIDPGELKRVRRSGRGGLTAESFESVAREWLAKFSPRWAESHANKITRRLELYCFPWLGARPISEITPPELLAALRRIEARGTLETAHRAMQNCGQVFRYAVATGRATRDPSGDLRGAIPPARGKHLASVTDPKAVGELLRAIDGYEGLIVTRCALRLAPLVFVRPGELRQAEWPEIDLGAAEWRIPAERMKMREKHVVSLARQAVEILAELHPLTGRGQYLFPSVRTSTRPMSNATLTAALRRMGYGGHEMTWHGFRSMASTLLNEQGWNRDAIERQLAHAERDSIRAAYNYAEHLPERRRMMQAWADYLDALRAGATVIPLPRVA